MISIYVTFRDQQEADKICLHLLTKKLVACSNTFPIRSSYLWKGKIKAHPEVACLLKAKRQNYRAIEAEIKRLHSYENPCIEAFRPAKASRQFLKWLEFA
ncbi:divalent-cation tolerance protein CutA [Candidatus Woesearchaeota archaeon]|nr:divalent-cation tolerance protein CutA [Candidatus Woesearchaeota archaeon]